MTNVNWLKFIKDVRKSLINLVLFSVPGEYPCWSVTMATVSTHRGPYNPDRCVQVTSWINEHSETVKSHSDLQTLDDVDLSLMLRFSSSKAARLACTNKWYNATSDLKNFYVIGCVTEGVTRRFCLLTYTTVSYLRGTSLQRSLC
jgi:hypothetical protein